MSILTWIEDKKRLKVLNAPKHSAGSTDSSKGLWTRCDKCGVILYIKHLKENQRVCFSCSYHLQMMSGERIENLLDKGSANPFPLSKKSAFSDESFRGFRSPSNQSTKTKELQIEDLYEPVPVALGERGKTFGEGHVRTKGDLKFCASHFRGSKGNPLSFPGEARSSRSTWRPLDETVSPCDPLKFHDQKAYTDRLQDAQERTGLQDAIQTGTGMIDGIPVALAVMDFSFMGGSMGSVVGEKITRLIEYATGEGLTLLIVSASGGARMQEGVFSLMQMAKISSALQIYQSCAKLLYISILTSPTTGGVTASFAMLGDIIFAEPKALIAFAGRRVIEQTLCEDLPDDFQTSEYMLHHGLVDLIVPRRFLRQALSETIRLYQNAPFKKRGHIPFGVQNPITFLTEEKIRRGWGVLTSSGTKFMSSKQYNSSALKRNQATSVPGFTNRGTKKIRESKSLFSQGNAFSLMPSSYNSLPQKELEKGSITRLSINSSEKSEPPKSIYREILTSFEIMLALFLSGNSKKQNQGTSNLLTSVPSQIKDLMPLSNKSEICKEATGNGLASLCSRRFDVPGFKNQASQRLQKSDHTSSSRLFLSGKIKSSFWLYNNCLLRASSTFDNKTFSDNHSKVKTSGPRKQSRAFFAELPQRKWLILGQSRKNQPLYSFLKNDFARYTCRTTVIGSPTFVPAKAKGTKSLEIVQISDLLEGGEVTQKTVKKKNEISLQNTGLALKNENGAVPTVEPVREKAFAPQKGGALFSQKSGLSFSHSKESWSFSKLLGVAFADKCFFNFSRKDCKALASKRILTSMKLATNCKPLIQKHYEFQKSKDFVPLLSQKVIGNRFAQKPVSFLTLCLHLSDLSVKSDKSSMKGQAKHNTFYVRLKSNFVQQVIFDYGFYCTSVTNLLKNVHNKHTFAGHTAKMHPLRAPRTNERQASSSSSFLHKFFKNSSKKSNKFLPVAFLQIGDLSERGYKAFSKSSMYPDKTLEQNRAGLNEDMPSSSLLYNFRSLAEAVLESNHFQSSDLQKSPGKSRSEHSQAFYSTQKKGHTVDRLNDTVFNRSAIGIKHTKYLRERALSFLQNLNLVENGLEKEQSPVTKKKKNKVSAISALSSRINKNQEDIISKKVSVTDLTSVENDIDFLNQAIELAATESVEWRAFYIHQQFSENKGFLDDFLQSEGVSDNTTQKQTSISTESKSILRPFFTQPSESVNQVGNVLFYKILCR